MKELNGKYYVHPCGWQGASYEELIADSIAHACCDMCDTYEEALQRVDYYWENILAPDECCYVVHPDGKIEEL